MNFLKSLKDKAIQQFKQQPPQIIKQGDNIKLVIEEAAKQKQKQREESGYLKKIKFKSIVNNLYTKFKEQSKNNQNSNNQNKNEENSQIKSKLVDGRFWHTAGSATVKQGYIEEESEKQKIQNVKQEQQENKANKIIQQLQITGQSAHSFVQNLEAHLHEIQKQEKQRIKKCKNEIFQDLSVEPIYMQQSTNSNIQIKIFKMELETNFQQLVQKTQDLVNEKEKIQRAIQNVLTSGYLWHAYYLENINYSSAFFDLMKSQTKRIQDLCDRVKDCRQRIKKQLQFVNKILDINRKSIKGIKKLNLLKKIREYKKDIQIRFQNIDQAFYIERNRQKAYASLISNQKLVSKVILLQSLQKKIEKQNQRLIQLLERELIRWIDKKETIQKKHIQKLFILLYFSRTQKMYTNKCIKVHLEKVKNRQKLIQQINEVKKWEDYKYVNDKLIKSKVKQFLDQIIRQISSHSHQYEGQKIKIASKQKEEKGKEIMNKKGQEDLMSKIKKENQKVKQKLQKGIKF